jgi:filamentous hemagglutinin family protein
MRMNPGLPVDHGKVYGLVHAHVRENVRGSVQGPGCGRQAAWSNGLFLLKALPAAAALAFALPGWAIDGAAGLPQNGTVAFGDANGSVSGNQLTINQSTERAVIDWASFSIGLGKAVQFVQPNAASAVLNRVSAASNASEILGSLSANGTVMLMNPNGVMFGANSVVNVASLIATTGTIDLNNFRNTGGALITGATGSIENQGLLTASSAGLVALVAPSVTNSGTIVATGGTIALAGSDRATISLNSGLYEFAIPSGATGVGVSNALSADNPAGAARLTGATILLGVGDAANLLSGVINLEGVQQASRAITVNGDTVLLKSALQTPTVSGSSNTVNVSGAARIQDGVNISRSGGAVNVAAGTYAQPATLKINKSLTLSGAGEGATIIDASGVTDYGINVTADDVTLKDFTLYGPSANAAASYGIKVAPSGGMSARLHDFAVSKVTIRGSGRAELDLNGVDGALIDHVTADGAPVGNAAGSTQGAGIQLTDSANVTVSNSTTRHNDWGGLALYQSNRFYDQQVNNITVAGNNSFTERNPVYMQDESATRDFGTLAIAGFDHAVRNSSSTNSNFQYTWLQASQQNAFDFAVNLQAAASSYVQGWNGAQTTQNFKVGTGHLLAGGEQAMLIGSAVGAAAAGAAVDVYAGTYAEQLVLNKTGLTLTGHDGARLVVPNAAEVNGIAIAANNVTVTGMEIAGPVTQSYLSYAWGNNISRGIAVGNGITGFTISNNNIHDVRNGILIDGRNTGSVTGNRIDNTKSAISVQYTDASGITIAGNTQGAIGNEWGLNLHLNGHMDGSNVVGNGTPISAAPTLPWQQALLDLSAGNAGWSVQDQAYTSSNRTHVNVATGGSSSAQGSALTPLNTVQGGVNAVVAGGTVRVAAGVYAESVTIGKALTLKGAGVDQSIVDPVSGDAIALGGNIGANASVLIDGFTFRDAPGSGVSVAGNTVLGQLTVQNSSFNNNGHYGFSVNGSATAGVPGLANVLLSDNTFEGNGNPPGGATALGLGDIQFNYFNGNASLKNLHITGTGEHTGIHLRGYHDAIGGAVHNAGTVVFDNVTLEGSFRRPSGTVGTWNPGGPGYAIHMFEYGSVANVSFSGVNIKPTVGHGLVVEGLGSTLNIGDTRFGMADTSVVGAGTNPTSSLNIITGSNSQNNVKTNVNATAASFTGAGSGFDIEDRVGHALDSAGLGLVTWNAGNVYVTQKSASVQRGADASSAGGTVNVAAGTYAEDVRLANPYRLLFNDATVSSLTLDAGAAGSGLGGKVTANGAGGIAFNAAVNLLGDTTLATTGADITLNGDIQNIGTTAYGLRLIAGTGATRGNVHMATGGSASNALGSFEVSSNQFSLLDTLWVKGYKIDALGSVALSNHTLRGQDSSAANSLSAGGDITGATVSQGSVVITSSGNIAANVTASDVAISAGGDISGTTNSAGNVQMTSGGDISGSVSGSNVLVQAQGDLNLAVVASSSASLAGDSVVVTVAAPVVAVAAVGDAQVSGSSSEITVDAPRGSVSGSFGQVTNSGGGLVNVNGKPQGNAQLSSNSDNSRVMPSGNPLTDGAGSEEMQGVQLAQAGALMVQSDTGGISLMAPGSVGEALNNGQSVELDLSPRNGPAQSPVKASSKDSEKEQGGL